MTPPTHWQRLRRKLYCSSTVWFGYGQIAVAQFLDVLPDILTVMTDPDISAAIEKRVPWWFPIWLRITGFLTVVLRLRKQILCLLLRKEGY